MADTPSVFMIDLDSLFDTRLGTLVTYMYDELQVIFTRNLYHNRLDDSFNRLIDKDKFYEYYNQRDKRVLVNSTLSLMVDIIRDFIAATATSDPSRPNTYYPVIYLNTYPYLLTDVERKNIQDGIFAYYKNKVLVELVHMDNRNISIEFIKNNVTVLAMYEYHKWLDTQTELGGFKSKSCSDVTLLGPRIFFKEVPKTEEVSNETFSTLETISKPFINLELLPSLFYSTYLKPNGKDVLPTKDTSGA